MIKPVSLSHIHSSLNDLRHGRSNILGSFSWQSSKLCVSGIAKSKSQVLYQLTISLVPVIVLVQPSQICKLPVWS